METVKKIIDVDPKLLPILEQLFSVSITQPAATEIVLRTTEVSGPNLVAVGEDGVPTWCNVLEGMSDEELAEFDRIVKTPIRLASE